MAAAAVAATKRARGERADHDSAVAEQPDLVFLTARIQGQPVAMRSSFKGLSLSPPWLSLCLSI